MFVCTIIIIATLCLWCIFHAGSALKALGWSKTSKNLRDRSFEVCLQDLNFFKKYLQTWGGNVSCAEVFKVPVSLSHTPAEIQLISCKRGGEEKAAADGAVWGRRKQKRRAWSRVSVTSAFSCASYHSVLFRLLNLRDSVKGGWNRSEWARNCVWLVEKILFFKHCVF